MQDRLPRNNKRIVHDMFNSAALFVILYLAFYLMMTGAIIYVLFHFIGKVW